MPKITAKTAQIVTSVVLELTNDEATHLSFFMRTAHGDAYGYKSTKYVEQWPWAKRFVEELDAQRGSGCTMGPRVKT